MKGKNLNLTGQKIGKYTVYKKDESKYRNWKCICECGKKLSIRGSRLVKNERDFCGCNRIKKEKIVKDRNRCCARCGKKYVMSEKAKHSKYCSKICKRNLKTKCMSCNKEIEQRKGIDNMYCSLICKIKNHYKVNEDGCWIWINLKGTSHLSRITFDGKRYTSGRIAYEVLKERIPENYVVVRKCKNHNCINPLHHEAITKERFFKESNHNNVTKNININIVNKIIELYNSGLTSEEILSQYKYHFKHKSFRNTYV
jgi:hypothetical protein